MDEKEGIQSEETPSLREKSSEPAPSIDEIVEGNSDIKTNGDDNEPEVVNSLTENHTEETQSDNDVVPSKEKDEAENEFKDNGDNDDKASTDESNNQETSSKPEKTEPMETEELSGDEEKEVDKNEGSIANDEDKLDAPEEEKCDAQVDDEDVDDDGEPKVETAMDISNEEESKCDVDAMEDKAGVVQESGSQEETIEEKEKDVDNIQFEDAPNVQNESREETSQSLDPFDALLNTTDEKHDESQAKDTNASQVTIIEDDDDDTIQVDDEATVAREDDTPGEEPALEGLGADEEVCLLPDTERELTDEDREKALQAKELLGNEPMEVTELKDENEAMGPEEGDSQTVENNEEAVQTQEAAADVAEEVPPEETVVEEEREKEREEDEVLDREEPLQMNTIQEIHQVQHACSQCSETKPCIYRYLKDSNMLFLCSMDCVKSFQERNAGYTLSIKKNLIEEIDPKEKLCSNCEDMKNCYFTYKEDGETYQYCSLACLHDMMGDDRDKYIFKHKTVVVEELAKEKQGKCLKCGKEKKCVYEFSLYGDLTHVCREACLKQLNDEQNQRFKIKRKIPVRRAPPKRVAAPAPEPKKTPMLKLKVLGNATDKYLDEGYKVQAKTPAAAAAAREDRERSFVRRCCQCRLTLSGADNNLSWETMDFCDEVCLGRYQNVIGSKCANCLKPVSHTALGKYCVRFGYDIRQFCASTCLEAFKKGLKICCYCQKDITKIEGIIAPVGDKGQFKDFCSRSCMEKFDQMSKSAIPATVWASCAVCGVQRPTQIEVALDEEHSQRLCSEPCFAAFKFVNSIFPDQCQWCKKYFERKSVTAFTIYNDAETHCFCSKSCINVFISNSRHIVPCAWCKVKKYNFDMIKRGGTAPIMMCSLNCLNLYQVSVNAVSSRRIKCDQCKRSSQAQYHLTMSDATVRNFCTYQCVMSFQSQYTKAPMLLEGSAANQAVPTGAPRRTYSNSTRATSKQQQQQLQQQQQQQQMLSNKDPGAGLMPVISSVQSLSTTRSKTSKQRPQPLPATPPVAPPAPPPPPPPPPPKIYNHVLVKTLPPAQVANKATQTKPAMVSKGLSCRPHPISKECQTDDSLERRVLIPVPVPIYVPVPLAMWSLPFPLPVPIPLPIPTPVFIPTTRNSATGIMKEIKKIHEKMPTDPFEAELLMMAEMVAGDKKRESDSETDEEETTYPGDSIETNQHGFGEDVLQMALKMATEPYEEPPVDLESAMTASTITPTSHPLQAGMEDVHPHHLLVLEQQRRAATAGATGRGGKRAPPAPAAIPQQRRKRGPRAKEPPPQPEPPREPQEKPDANMCLKYTFGVNAWKQWVMTKNAELEKSSIRRKPFKSEILQLPADELNYSLCLFVKEVRKPNGSEYAPDTIYYLVLGIQQYLFENGRIDNIFTDPYYEKFTDCLDEVARKFSVLYNDSQYIVTRVEEEHLWECKQLGAHSPHVLLSTLMFFNTKHFNLVTVEEHMQLSFSHIMKHWKRNPNQPGAVKMAGSRNVLLRFYPPQSALEANSRKKKVYEQQENEENPLRCPVKLYEFYISKCPESVRTRNDVFYLMPERSCVPDSPVWYSTQPLARDALAKMLHRVKMVKEINIALLTS